MGFPACASSFLRRDLPSGGRAFFRHRFMILKSALTVKVSNFTIHNESHGDLMSETLAI
jgi:hypothetical protein